MSLAKVLEKSPLTSRLSSHTREEFLRLFSEEVHPRGARDNSWDADRFFVFLIEGRIEVSRTNENTGRSLTLFLLGPGDGFDILKLLDSQQHDVQSEALDELRLLKARYEQVREFMAQHPDFNEAFYPYLGKQLRDIEDLATDLGLYPSLTRLARLILRKRGTSNGVTVPLLDSLSDEKLASMIGSVRQTINKHLQEWRSQGVLDGSKIAKLEALENIAGLRLVELTR